MADSTAGGQNLSPRPCECGCGEPAPIATQTKRKHGHVQGQPMRFIRGHQAKRPRNHEADFWERVDIRGPYDCWLWTGSRNGDGYGQTTVAYREVDHAHRAVLRFGGVDVRGRTVHHRCETPACVNPAHLQVCADNTEHRALHRKGCGKHGETYIARKRSGKRFCRACKRAEDAQRNARRGGVAA